MGSPTPPLASKEQLRQHVMDVLRARDESPAAKRNSRLWDAEDLIQTVLAFDGKHGETARLRRALEAEATECERCTTTDAADEGLHLSANNIF